MFELHRGDCRQIMASMEANSIDAAVTDPPYGLSKEPNAEEMLHHWLARDDYTHGGGGFMGKTWDSFVPGPATWREVFRVLKPGGYALVFAGSRTQDLMSLALRLAGFEIRDVAMWIYGSGFPKSLDVGKAIDKRGGVGTGKGSTPIMGDTDNTDITEPHTEAAKQWHGYGTALKPAYEPIIIARKPLIGTVADNVLTHGTGAINVDECRIPSEGGRLRSGESSQEARYTGRGGTNFALKPGPRGGDLAGRWPANVLHDGLEEDWARYFYCPKTSKADRNAGCDHLNAVTAGEATGGRAEDSDGLKSPRAGAGRTGGAKNHHPTVKPTELMRWLCRLVGHPGATILDPFAGSGSTGKAAILEGFSPIMIEMTPEYWPIIEARCSWACWQRFE